MSRKRREPSGKSPEGRGARFRVAYPVARFLGLFLLLTIPLYVLMGTEFFQHRFFPGYLGLNASAAGKLLGWLGVSVVTVGTIIRTGGFSIEIAYGCDGIEPAWLFAAAALAFPVPGRLRLLGAAVGVTILLVVNLFRVVTLFLIGLRFPSAFELFHIEIWQTLFVLITIGLWIFWAQWALRRPAGKHEPHP